MLTLRDIQNTGLQVQILNARRLSARPLACLDCDRLARDDVSPLLGGNAGAEPEPAESGIADALDGERLAHNGAAAGNDLQVGHGAAASAGGSTRGESTEGARGGIFEERTQTAGLVQERLHRSSTFFGGTFLFIDECEGIISRLAGFSFVEEKIDPYFYFYRTRILRPERR